MSLLGVLLFSYLVLLMHMFLFMFTCMEEQPANSRADLQTGFESRKLDELLTLSCQLLPHSHSAYALNSLQFFYPRLDALSFNGSTFTQILNVVLHFNSQGQAVSQGLSSRTVTSVSLISN